MTAWVYDATRSMIDVVTSDGSLYGWSLAQNAFTTSLHVGGAPDTVDISADGRYLLIGSYDRMPNTLTVTGAGDLLIRVNLQTQTLDSFRVAFGAFEGRVTDV